MAITLNNDDQNAETQQTTGLDINNIGIDNIDVSGDADIPVDDVTSTIEGLSSEEMNDPNSIKVCISDKNTPIVVLYGPPSCGKTMTLVRMTRYLQSQGFQVIPDKTFRPSYDSNYRELCDNFDTMINSTDAARSTKHISFMLVKVLKAGRPICQILEAPGELYFNPDNPNLQYPAYVYEILQCINRKVWAIMVEPNWTDAAPRANYVRRIANLKTQMSPRDKVLFVYNKIDMTPFVRSVGQVDTALAIKNIQDLYNGIFVPFLNQNPITKFFNKYNCEFVPFMTGSYVQKMGGGLTYIEGHELYAKKVWNMMLKLVKG